MPYSQEEFTEYVSSDIAQVGGAPEVSNSIESKARRVMAIAGPFIPIGGIALAAKYGFKERLSGGRVWDVYYNFLKQLEGGLPYGIFSTFHTSEIISPFAAPGQYALSPDKFGKLYKNIEFKNYLSRTTGVSFGALQKAGAFDKGIEWKRTGKVLGELSVIGGPTLAKDIGLLSTGARRGGHILEWYARIQGATAPNFLKAFQEGFGQLRPEFLPIGSMGRGPASLAADYLYSLFSSSVGRLNLLLNSPLDLEATKDLARKVPFLGRLNLGVKPGTGLQMLGRYTGKAAVAFAGIHALGFTDFLAGGEPGEDLSRLGFLRGPLVGGILGAGAGFGIGLKSLGGVGRLPLRGFVIGAGLGLLTPFRDGPITGLAGSYAWLRVAQASISKGLGLSEGARRTEDYFEGATSPKTLVGMAGAGLLLGGTKDYFRNLAAARTVSALRGKVAAGKVARSVYEIAEKALTSEKELYYQLHTSKMGGADSTIVRTIESAKARFFGGRMDRAGNFRAAGAGRWAAIGAGGYSILSAGLSLLAGDVTGGLIQGAAGVAAAGLYLKGKGSAGVMALLAAPFLLREKEDPEYLKRVYSGEEKVEVKAGRAWEIGRCNTANSLITLNEFGEAKRAEDVEPEDTLLGADGLSHKILNIFSRQYEGEIFEFATVIDRNVYTGLTSNHIVPVIRPGYSYSSKRGTYWEKKADCSIVELTAEEIQINDFVQIPCPVLPDENQEEQRSNPLGIIKRDGKLFAQVISIKKSDYSGKVYDFEIDHEDHLIQNGTFLVHNSPYEGKRPRYREHRVAMMRAKSQEAALYGSSGEYWKTSPLLFPGRFLLNPYERDEMLWDQGWKFPVTKVPFEDFPILGPLLASTVGSIIKPPKLQGEEEWQRSSGRILPGGHRELPGADPVLRTSTHGVMGELFYNISELSGLPGFTTQSITQSLIGTKTPYTRPQLASASLVGGMEPSWWSLDLGGMGLLSESLRRYIPVRRSEIEYRNPLPSDLPSWLPGEDYIFDFSRADIYTKIDEPWARLPGSGFAALNAEVKGIDPENYSPYWRFKILADLAPYSKEYGRYEELMSRYAAENRLTAEERLEIERTRAQVSRVKKEHDFNAYAYDNQAVQRRRVTVTGVAEDGGFYTDSFGSAKVSLEGVSTARTTIAASLMRKDASLTASQALSGAVRKRAQVSDFLNQYIYPGAQLDLFVHKDPSLLMERGLAGEPTIRAIASDLSRGGSNINRALMESGLGDPFSDGRSLKPTMATNWLQRNAGSFFENLMHGMETPLESFVPLAPVAKFIHQRNPLEEYERSRVYAREVSLWEKPVSHFLAPGLRTTAWWLGWRGIPGEVRARYMVEEYFDRLQYMKAKNLETAAIMQGSGGAASEASMQARRTMTGANRYSPLSARLSIPIHERAYFDEFIRAPTGAERARIDQIVSPQMSELLRAQWYRNSVAGSQLRTEAGIGTARDMMAIGTYNDVMDNEAISRDSRAAAAMTNVPIPGPRWLGWNQGADIQDVKIKTILDADMDLTAFGIWDSDLRRVARRPDIKPIRIEFQSNTYDRPSSFSFDDTFRRATGVQSMSGFRTGISASPGNRFEIRDPGYSRMDSLLRDPTITTF